MADLHQVFQHSTEKLMKINKIVIVGGGSSGWMTAATLIKLFPSKKITLIESKNHKIVGVGESTLGTINQWLSLLKIKDKDFLPYTDGSYKLSIRFEDFYRKDESFHYPFGLPCEDNLWSGKNTWYFKKMLKRNTMVSNYANFLYPQMQLVKYNRIGINKDGELGNFSFADDTAYHFDATKFGQWLKEKICIPEGVEHIIDDIDSVEQDENGVVSLNNKYKADLYIDCTGFKSLLLGENLKVPFKSYENLLPNNSAWATRIPYEDKEKQLVPYTNCKAVENGWIWTIPSWNRIGTGYVYSDKYISDEDALAQFKKHLGKEDIEANNIKMRIGMHEKIFVKNVVAIGLSAGFIEPLESNGLFTVHEFLIELARTLRRPNVNQLDRDEFNHCCKGTFDRFAEFVAVHYYMSARDDTQYWRDLTNKSIAKEKMGSYDIERLIEHKNNYNYYSETGLQCIATGMYRFPTDDIALAAENYLKEKTNDWLVDKYGKDITERERAIKRWKEVALTKPKLIDVLTKIHAKRD